MKTCLKKIAALRAEYVNISVFMFSLERATPPSSKSTPILKICKFQDFLIQCY